MEDQDKTIIRTASKAAQKVLKDRSVFGMDADDFAMEAWIYVKERHQPLKFVPIRARFLAIDKLRRLLGRQERRQERVEEEVCKEYFWDSIAASTESSTALLLDTSLPDTEGLNNERFKHICEGLAIGYTRTEIARHYGLSQTRITQIIDKFKDQLSPEDPKCRSKAKHSNALCSPENLKLHGVGQQRPQT